MLQVLRGRYSRASVVASLVEVFDQIKCEQPNTVGVFFKFRLEELPDGEVRCTVCILLSLSQVIYLTINVASKLPYN